MLKIIEFVMAFALVVVTLPVSAKITALKNINVVDVQTLTIKKSQTVIIEDKVIVSVYDSKKSSMPKNAIVIDLTDKYLMPGLIDTHVHHGTEPDGGDNDQLTRQRLRGLLRGGVTSVRDMGGDARALSSLKRRAEIDAIQSPDIYYSVIIGGGEFFADPRTVASALGRTPGHVDWMRAVDHNTNLDEVMLKARGTGATGVKIYAKVPANLLPKLATTAKKHGLKVWSHAFIGPAKPMDAIVSGIETISHAPDLSAQVIDNFYQLRRQGQHVTEQQQQDSMEVERYQSVLNAMVQHNTIFDPTLTVFDKNKAERGKWGALMDSWGKMFTKLAHDKGITIATGTDGASDLYKVDFPLVLHEMRLLVNEVGFTPLEAIQAATINGAKVIGIAANHGLVQSGYVANLVVLNSNPSTNIDHVQDIAHVIKNGQFVYRGDNKALPFVAAKKAAGMLWMSGQIGNLPSTMLLAGDDIESQMAQAMKNIGDVLEEHDLGYSDVVKCTLMLDDIKDWQKASAVYKEFFSALPARSAFATGGLALGAKVEVECLAEL